MSAARILLEFERRINAINSPSVTHPVSSKHERGERL